MFHYVYRINRLDNLEWYIGLSSCNCWPTKDTSYMGSGKLLKRKLKAHGRKSFRKSVLAIVEIREEAERIEAALVGPAQVADPLCLNLREGGFGGEPGKEGENNGMSKLTDAIVLAARLNVDGLSIKRLAELYGVRPVTIWCVVKRKTWKHLPPRNTDCVFPKPGNPGEAHGAAKLTEEQVLEIRSNVNNLTYKDLVKLYGVSKTTIGQIIRGERWKSLLQIVISKCPQSR